MHALTRAMSKTQTLAESQRKFGQTDVNTTESLQRDLDILDEYIHWSYTLGVFQANDYPPPEFPHPLTPAASSAGNGHASSSILSPSILAPGAINPSTNGKPRKEPPDDACCC
jgi:hypothetical protein